MSRRIILLCLLPSILIAARSENGSRTDEDFKNNQRIKLITELDHQNDADLPSRRMSHWMGNLFNPKSQTTTTNKNINGLLAREVHNIEDPVAVQKYLITVLLNLTQAIAKLTQTLQKNDPVGHLVSRIDNANEIQRNNFVYNPIGLRRYKRDISKTNKDEVSVDNSEANFKVSNSVAKVNTDISATTAMPVTGIRTVTGETFDTDAKEGNNETLSVNAKRTSNITPSVKNNDLEADFNDSNKIVNNKQELEKPSRRMQSENKHENSDIKIRILSYADDAYEEINKKLAPVKMLKANYETNRFYKLGYLIANIDTLELNVNNLKKDLDSHKDEWDDKTVLDLFDKLMVSNKVVSKLMEQIMSIPSNQPEPKIARN